VVACLIGGCGTSTATGTLLPSVPPTAASPSPLASPSATPVEPTASAAPTPTAATSCVARTLASLTEAQRIGQLFIIGLIKNRLDASERAGVANYHFGSMTFTTQSSAGVAAIRALTDAVQAQATPEATGGAKFLVAANQEGGLIQGLSGPGFDTIPSALSQGTMAPAVLQAKAARWARQLRAAGINLNFAPVADVVPPGTDSQNAPIGELQREYGHDPATVSSHVAAFIAGMRESGVATTAKHFPGLGRVTGHTDYTANVIDSVTTRTDPYLAPFATAVRARVPFLMVSLATYERIDPAHLAVFSPIVIDGMLRGDLAYRGVVISDALGAAAVASIPPGTRAIDFLDAGGDMIVVNQLAPAIEMATALAARAATDPAFRHRIDTAALRVLRVKQTAGLLPCGG
jgi:beta-N-acetylhexosaminidase